MNFVASHLITCIVALPLVTAVLALTFPKGSHSGVLGFCGAAMLTTLGLGLWALTLFDSSEASLQLVQMAPWVPGWGAQYAVGVDALALVMMLLTMVISPLCLCAAALLQEGPFVGKERSFVVNLLFLEGAVLGAFAAIDLLLFYVFWEAMLIPAFFLIGIFGVGSRAQSARRFFLYTMAGSMVMLAALICAGLFAPGNGPPSFLWTDVVARFAGAPVSYTELALFCAFALAFAIKVPLFPLHGWLPGAYNDAPQSVTVMLSAVMVKVGAFALLRYSLLMFPRSATFMMPTLALLAVVGILYGACTALAQDNLRKILAYSSISHMGFVALGMMSMAPDALLGSALQMVNHAISTGALFILVGLVIKRQHTDALVHLGGMAERMPMLATVFVFMALSSMGLPGLNGFVGEFLILLGTFGSGGLSLSLAEGALAQGAILMVTFWVVGAAIVMVRYLFVWGRARGSNLSFPFAPVLTGGLLIVAAVAYLVMPPLGRMPGGVLLRPMLQKSLSIVPFAHVMPIFAVAATLGVLLGAVYLLVAIERSFLGKAAPTRAAASRMGRDLSAKERWLLVPFVVSALLLGLYPAPLMHFLEPTMRHYAEQFRERAGWPTDHLPWPDAKAYGAPPVRLVPVGPGTLHAPDREAP